MIYQVFYENEDGVFLDITKYIKTSLIIEEARKTALEMPASTIDLTLFVNDIVDFKIENNREIRLVRDEQLELKTFVTDVQKSGENGWSIKSTDYIGVLEYYEFKSQYYGDDGILYLQKTLGEVLSDLFDGTNVPYEISDEDSAIQITGHVKNGVVRQRLQELCLSFGLIATTINSESLVIKKDVQLNARTTPKEVKRRRIKDGMVIQEKPFVSSISVDYSQVKPDMSNYFVGGGELVYDAYPEDGVGLEEWMKEWEEFVAGFDQYITYTFPNIPVQVPTYDDDFALWNRFAYGITSSYEFVDISTFEVISPYEVRVKRMPMPNDGNFDPSKPEGFRGGGVVHGKQEQAGFKFKYYRYESSPAGTEKVENEHQGQLRLKNDKVVSAIPTMTQDNAKTALQKILNDMTIGQNVSAKIISGRDYIRFGEVVFGDVKFQESYEQEPIYAGDNVDIIDTTNEKKNGFVQKTTLQLSGTKKVLKECEIV